MKEIRFICRTFFPVEAGDNSFDARNPGQKKDLRWRRCLKLQHFAHAHVRTHSVTLDESIQEI